MDRRDNKIKGRKSSKSFWIISILAVIAIVLFFISYSFYTLKLGGINKELANDNYNLNNVEYISIIPQNDVKETSTELGKKVQELEEEKEESISEKIAINTSGVINSTLEEEKIESEVSENVVNYKNVESYNLNENEMIKLICPVEGEILKDYSDEKLVYSETLKEWTTHLGIDYKVDKTSVVKSAADGVVKYIKDDPRYGKTVCIEHKNGISSIYANLLSTEFITIGENVVQGQTIATVGNSAMFEIADESHLHFEVKLDNKNINPNLYF